MNESKNEEQILNQEKIREGINKALSNTAEKLDQTAETLQKTAAFFREKDADSLKDDMANMVKKYPGHALIGVLAFGFVLGRLIAR